MAISAPGCLGQPAESCEKLFAMYVASCFYVCVFFNLKEAYNTCIEEQGWVRWPLCTLCVLRLDQTEAVNSTPQLISATHHSHTEHRFHFNMQCLFCATHNRTEDPAPQPLDNRHRRLTGICVHIPRRHPRGIIRHNRWHGSSVLDRK